MLFELGILYLAVPIGLINLLVLLEESSIRPGSSETARVAPPYCSSVLFSFSLKQHTAGEKTDREALAA